MVINFRARVISRDARKMTQTSMLIIIKKIISIGLVSNHVLTTGF